MSGGKHGPNRLSNYMAVHNTNMDQVVRSGFVLSNDLVVSAGNGYFTIEGLLRCAGGIEIDVRKRVEVLGGDGASAIVQTVTYSYNVRVRGTGNVFRYDSPDPVGGTPGAPSHHAEHHVHRYDVFNGDKRGEIECIYDSDRVPTLREVIDEASDWFYSHVDEIVRTKK